MSGFYERTDLLYGEKTRKVFTSSSVVVFGLGGVGGTAFEALVRSGVGKIFAVDYDVVSESNLNRQVLFTREEVEKGKALSAQQRANSINPLCEVVVDEYKVSKETLCNKDYLGCSFLIDAMDDLNAKIAVASYALEHDIGFAISLGMANRFDPSKLLITTLNKTEGDPLARKLRSLAREKGLPLDKILCVCSKEIPVSHNGLLSSSMIVPSTAGLFLASLALDFLSKQA